MRLDGGGFPLPSVLVEGAPDRKLALALAAAYTVYHDLKLGHRPSIDRAVATGDFESLLTIAHCTARVVVRDYGLRDR